MLDYHLYIYASILSFFTGAFVVITYTIYTRTTPWRKSQFLMWAFRLVCVNTLFSLVALVWNFMALRMFTDTALEVACRAYLPFPIYFFLCGYGCNIFIACRFTTNPGSIESNLVSKTPIYFVWASSFVMVLPVIILNTSDKYYVSNVIDYDSELTDKGSYCMFNHSDMRAQMVNNICFQVPLVLTLGINLWAYVKGLHALQDAPHSVVSREMRRAGVYMSVLLLVWIPNFTVNVLTELHVHAELDIAMEVIVMLTGLQGFLNSVVFLWGYPKYRRWLHNKMIYLCCYCLVDPYDKYDYKRRHSGIEGDGLEPLLSDDRMTSTTASNSHSLRSPNDSSNESCDIHLRGDSLRFPGTDPSTSVSSAVSSLRSSFSRGYRSSSVTNRETYYSAIPEYEEEEGPARRMSTVDKIVRFSASDYMYYNKDDPVCAATDIEDLSTTGATNDVSSAGQEEGGRTRSIDVRIDMSGAEDGGFADDNESSFLSEEDDSGGHSLASLQALEELREEAAEAAQKNEVNGDMPKGDEELKFTSPEVLGATMKRSVSADHALNHHDLHYCGPLSESHSNEVTSIAPHDLHFGVSSSKLHSKSHSILKTPEPRPHLISPFRHSDNHLPYPARTAAPVVPGLQRWDSEQEVRLLETNTTKNSAHHHLHYYEKPLYRLTHHRADQGNSCNTVPASETSSEAKGHKRRNSADGSVLGGLHVKPSNAQSYLLARMY